MDTQATFLATLVDEWARAGVTDAVVCPGNRSAMLSAILEKDSRINVHVMVDERSASFFALGLGKATGHPALFWCTSGTAAAEAHAAVIEAHYSRVPVLVCTANRPPELQHVRDWQSIDQTRLYEGMTRWHFAPGVADNAMRDSWRSIASRAVIETMFNPVGPGPVHLDLAIREPWKLDVGTLPPARANDAPWHAHLAPEFAIAHEMVADFVKAERGVIAVGECDVDPDAVYAAAQALGWPVFAEARSGCRRDDANCVSAFDSVLRVNEFAAKQQPEVVLQLGTPSISKAFAGWIKSSNAAQLIVDSYNDWSGSKDGAAVAIRADPNSVLRALSTAANNKPKLNWLTSWQEAEAKVNAVIDAELTQRGLTEPLIARLLATQLGEINLFAATSMPVRDVEGFSTSKITAGVFANRGASGMDGITSTAAGVAFATSRPTVLLTGDLSFLYDLNALWALQGTAEPVNMAIVVVDNHGGGIFSTLPQLSGIDHATFERVIATPQTVDITGVAEALGSKVERVSERSDLIPAVKNALAVGGIRIVYVATTRDDNAKLHKDIYEAVASALA